MHLCVPIYMGIDFLHVLKYFVYSWCHQGHKMSHLEAGKGSITERRGWFKSLPVLHLFKVSWFCCWKSKL